MAKIRSGSMIASFLVVAALLPAVLMGVLNPDGLRLISKADQPRELRLWIEPTEVVVRPGVAVKLTVMANFENETSQIPEFQGNIVGASGLQIAPSELVYKEPFRGTVVLGTISAIAKQTGSFEVKVDEGSVFLNLPDVPVISAGSKIISRR